MMNPSPIAREYLEKGRSTDCPIIDMHGHLGPFYGAYLPSATLERMRQRMARCGVQRLVCSHHLALTYDSDEGNALLQDVIDAYPGEFLGYWLINPNFPAVVEKDLVNFDKTRGFVGLKFWPDYHHVTITSIQYAAALEYANAHKLLVLIHTWGGSPFDRPALIAELAERYTQAQFLMGHSGYGEWDVAVGVSRDYPNVYLDLTSVVVGIDFSMMPGGSLMAQASAGSPQVNGIVEYFVEVAGSKKIVYGSDLPWYSQHYHAGAVLFARISDEARHDILHRNAEQLLGSHLDRGRPQS